MIKNSGMFATALLVGCFALGPRPAWAQAVQFFAVLEGGNEVSGTTAAAGDLNSYGTASVMLGGAGQLCFSILVRNADPPTGAHIHEANAGKNGPIVIGLTAPSSGNPGASSGCLTGVTTTVISRLRSTPSKFYVNVHTTKFPGGALRGQLF